MPALLRWPALSLALVAVLAACSEKPAPAPQDTAAEAASSASPDAETLRQQNRAKSVEIIRDDYGVAHIYGNSDADAVFGLLYAQAEDDFPRVERNYIWAMGRLAEVEGEEALFSDLRARLYMTEIEARQAYSTAPDWLKKLCIAFADGLNYYLRTHPDVTPKLITHFEPWMPMYFFEGSIGGDIEQIPLGGIEAFYSRSREEIMAGVPVANTPAPARPEAAEPSGSNGIALAGKLTDSGNTLLLINPHTSFYFRSEYHMVSNEGLNAYGAVTWGQFFIYQGFNEHTGWMHTSTYADFMDEFVEDVVTQDGRLQYHYGQRLRPLTQWEETLYYQDGDEQKSRRFPMLRTHHGPITHMQDGRWVATKINWDPVNALRQSWLRTKQADHAGFREIMDIRTNSSNNTVFADSSGNIAYYHGNFMPRRDNRFDYSQPVDGSNTATDWQGLHEVDETVHVVNPDVGWLQNCNSTPYTSAGANSPKREDYPAYMAPDPENFRGLHAAMLLAEFADSADDKMSMDELIALAYHPALPAFDVLVPGLLEAWESEGENYTALAEPIAALRDWDRNVAADSVPMSLGHFYGLAILDDWQRGGPYSRMQWIQGAAERHSPADRLALLAGVIEQLQADFGDWQTPWGEINRFQRLSGAIDLDFDDEQPSLPVGMTTGRWGALAAYGSRPGSDTKRLYGYRGNSFVAVVEFGDKVRAKSLLAGGQSGDPASPHFLDQAERYINRDFKDVAYYREDVEARASRRYHPGERHPGE